MKRYVCIIRVFECFQPNFPENFNLFTQKLDGSMPLLRFWELKSSRDFVWDQSDPKVSNYESNYYSISDGERTAISMGYGGTLHALPKMYVSQGPFTVYFKINSVGKTHSMGHGIGLMDEHKTQCHPKYGGFVVNSDTGKVFLDRKLKGKLYKKENALEMGDIICAKGNLKTNEYSLSLIRDGLKFGKEIQVIWNDRIGDTVRPAISFDTEKWSVTLL